MIFNGFHGFGGLNGFGGFIEGGGEFKKMEGASPGCRLSYSVDQV